MLYAHPEVLDRELTFIYKCEAFSPAASHSSVLIRLTDFGATTLLPCSFRHVCIRTYLFDLRHGGSAAKAPTQVGAIEQVFCSRVMPAPRYG